MPIFSRVSVLVGAASLCGAALASLLLAQAGPQAQAGDTLLQSPAVEAPLADTAEPAPDAFAAGIAAYNAGDIASAVAEWQTAADKGHIGAQWNLARTFATGETRDPRRWIHYLRLVASQYDADAAPGPHAAVTLEALIELARIYWQGDAEAEIEPDPQRAYAIFEHTATLSGHPRAQHFLGLMYLRGEGIGQDVPRAIRWLFLAARKQYAPSQAALGDFFWRKASGQSASTDDRLRAMMWYALAAGNAHNDELRFRFEARYAEAIAQASGPEREKVASLVDGWNDRSSRTVAQALVSQ